MVTHRITRSATLTIAGQVVPLAVAVMVLPRLSRALGVESLGLLSLLWLVFGYFSVLDLGLGLAVTRAASGALAAGDEPRVRRVFWTALMSQACLGSAGGLLLWMAAPAIAHSLLGVSTALSGETVRALRLCSAGVPFVAMTPSLLGLLQAAGRFDVTVLVQTPAAIGQYALPYLGALAGLRLSSIIGLLVALRILSFLALCFAANRVVRGVLLAPAPSGRELHGLIAFGGWVSLGSLVGPLVLYADRIIITNVLSLSSVAYYAVPADMLMRVLIIPGSVMTVVFPSLSRLWSQTDLRGFQALANKTAAALSFVMILPLGFLMLAAHDVMTLWMGAAFAGPAAPVLSVLSVGAYANSVARVPYAALQAIGRPDLPSKLQVFALPFQIVGCYALTLHFGLAGAAAGWTLRLILELLALLVLVHKVGKVDVRQPHAARVAGVAAFIGTAAFCVFACVPPGASILLRACLYCAWALCSTGAIIAHGLTPVERRAVVRIFGRES